MGVVLGLFLPAVVISAAGPIPSERSEGQGLSARRRWLSQDLRLTAGDLLSDKTSDGRHLLVCREGFSLVAAGRQLTSQSAVVRIIPTDPEAEGVPDARYRVEVYLSGPSEEELAAKGPNVPWQVLWTEDGRAAVLKLVLGGEVYITTDKNDDTSPQGLLLYRRALEAFDVAGLSGTVASEPSTAPAAEETVQARPTRRPEGLAVSIAPRGESPVQAEVTSKDGVETITIIGRIYLWWQQTDDQTGGSHVIELEADNIVLWRYAEDPNRAGTTPLLGELSGIGQVYVAGDVLMREGQRTIRASELYYDLIKRRGLANNAVFRTYDAERGIPLYIRAAQLRQVAANRFEADDVVLTPSEFHTPQVSVTASKLQVIDNTVDMDQGDTGGDSRFDAKLEDVRFKYYDTTLFAWPALRPNFQRPDVPIKSVSVGSDSTYGTSVETRWFLSRILGLKEPQGTDSTLSLDYFSKRGVGGGVEVDYTRDTYFGRLLTYGIDDHGEDRLSRTEKNVDVTKDMRGRFALQHRHFLPYDWQVTVEASYLSDKNFLEQYYRGEYNLGKEQETLIHAKRIEDNWGLSLLAKARINDFLDKVEEQPTAEFHWTGQSFLDDRLTFYSDNQVSRYRYLYGVGSNNLGPEDFFTYTMTRNEIDMPLAVSKAKIVPFVAGTFGYEDGAGFRASLDDSPIEPEEMIWVGEGGVRISAQPYWKVYPGVQSQFWDLDQLRHVIRPHLTAVAYTAGERVEQQRDTLEFGISQRWQTKRGPERRTVDWLRFNVDFVWVDDSGNATAGPDQFLWNKPFIPWVNRSGSVLWPQDRRTTSVFGPQRNYVETDLVLQLSDTTAILGDMNVDMQSGVVQQINVGVSRFCWPNLSYYVGSRYLRRIESGGEVGSNAVTFAATYVMDPRYAAVFSQQYDFDYGAGIRSDITLIRKYHRMNLALTLSADESLDERSILLSLWPQGVPELAIGQRRYTGLEPSQSY